MPKLFFALKEHVPFFAKDVKVENVRFSSEISVNGICIFASTFNNSVLVLFPRRGSIRDWRRRGGRKNTPHPPPPPLEKHSCLFFFFWGGERWGPNSSSCSSTCYWEYFLDFGHGMDVITKVVYFGEQTVQKYSILIYSK